MSFYDSDEWLLLRCMVLRHYGFRCQCCGASGRTVELHVDHIKPRSKHPELELTFSNCQVACKACNLGKSNRFDDDWRDLGPLKPTLNPDKLRAYISSF